MFLYLFICRNRREKLKAENVEEAKDGPVYCKTNICYEVSAHWKGLVDKRRWNKFFKQSEGKDCSMQHQFIPFHEGMITPNEKDLAAIAKVRIIDESNVDT